MSTKGYIRRSSRALLDMDERVHELAEATAGRLPQAALTAVSKLGDQPQQRLIAGAVLLSGLLLGKERMTRAGARMILAHEAATAAKDLAKHQVDRHRPRSADTRDERKLHKGNHTSKELSSFPSGHSAGALASARAFSREYPQYGLFALAGAGLVAAAQLPRRAHYATDILAGFALGLIAEAAADAAMRRMWRDGGPG